MVADRIGSQSELAATEPEDTLPAAEVNDSELITEIGNNMEEFRTNRAEIAALQSRNATLAKSISQDIGRLSAGAVKVTVPTGIHLISQGAKNNQPVEEIEAVFARSVAGGIEFLNQDDGKIIVGEQAPIFSEATHKDPAPNQSGTVIG